MIHGYWQVSRRAWSLSVQAYDSNPGGSRKFKRHLRWSAAAALREASTSRWFTFLDQPELGPFLTANPRLAFRPMGGYMSSRWAWGERARVIRDTYGFIVGQGGFLLDAMVSSAGKTLARIPLGGNRTATLWIGPHSQFRKEGEVTVFLFMDTLDGPVSGLSFSLAREGPGWECYVGGLQGRKGGDEDAIKEATKAFQGLRPKALMVFVAQEIARSLRVSRLLGVGNQIHIFRSRILGPPRKILFDFDELWLEAGAKPGPDGWFIVPVRSARRGPENVRPNKRAQYARRYALMDELSRQIKTLLTPFPRR
ncbi:MAG: DUF535 family protein [Acidobacteria bacterium]|nr:DUF535 family protein [Acidobacteriota bacterium]